MDYATIFANVLAVVCFLWLIHKAVLTAVATPARCRLLDLLIEEWREFGGELQNEFHNLREQLRRRTPEVDSKDLPEAVERIFQRLNLSSESSLPKDYQPPQVLLRIVIAEATGRMLLAQDELQHWQRRISFGWHHNLHIASKATRFGLLFTVVGVFLALAKIENMAKPAEMFGALSVAMLTTIAGLLVSLAVTYALLQCFGGKLRQLEHETEEVALSLRSDVAQVVLAWQRFEKQKQRRKRRGRQSTATEEKVDRIKMETSPNQNGGNHQCTRQ